MKKLLFWMVLIVGIVVILGSCAKKDETTTATTSTATTSTTTSITTTTPSGSITLGSYTVSGVYKSGCYSSGVSVYVAAGAFPTDVQSFAMTFVVTGNDNFTQETHTFTDTGCTTSSYITKAVRDNVTVGTASGSNYPVTYNKQGSKLTVNTTTAKSFLETLYSNVGLTYNFTVGTEKTIAGTGSLAYGLWTPGATTIYLASESSDSTPSTAGATVLTKE